VLLRGLLIAELQAFAARAQQQQVLASTARAQRQLALPVSSPQVLRQLALAAAAQAQWPLLAWSPPSGKGEAQQLALLLLEVACHP
jgi:hypothetical protein